MSKAKKGSSNKGQALPGSKISDHFNTAKKQTKDLLARSKKNVSTAKLAEQSHAKKHKLAQDNLKKHESSHKAKPSKSTSKNIVSAKAKVKQAQGLHAKAMDSHAKAKEHHSNHQNHYDKLNHLHNAVSEADKKWSSSNQSVKPSNVSNNNSRKKTR